MPHYIEEGTDLSFWVFLHAASVSNAPPSITIDSVALRRRILSAFPFGFSEMEESETARTWNTSVQSLYRAWGTREADLERVRPYFNDAKLRDRIMPLEVVVTGRQRELEKIQAPKAAKASAVLRLRGRPKAP